MISSWVTDAAPCRCAVPRQSAPVSPPPRMTTCLPAAVIGVSSRSPCCTRLAHGQVLHGLVDAAELAALDGQLARQRRPRGDDDGVVALAQVRAGEVDADRDARPEARALGLHLREPLVEVALLHLELGDAVAQQAADPVGPLEDDDGVTGPGQLLRGGQPGRTGADDRDRPPGQPGRRLRREPALVPGPVDDRRPRPA